MSSNGMYKNRLTDDRSIKESYQDLAGAICAQAVKDYMSAYKAVLSGRRERRDSTVQTMEKFFRSEWFVMLIGGAIDGEMVIQEVRKKCRRTSRTT